MQFDMVLKTEKGHEHFEYIPQSMGKAITPV